MRSGRAGVWVALALLSACAGYLGTARTVDCPVAEPGLLYLDDVEPVMQRGPTECGQAALCMALRRLGDGVAYDEILRACAPEASGRVSMQTLRDVARGRGFAAFVVAGSLADVREHLGKHRSLLVGTKKKFVDGDRTHFELVVGLNDEQGYVLTADPARGFTRNVLGGFLAEWQAAGAPLLLVAP